MTRYSRTWAYLRQEPEPERWVAVLDFAGGAIAFGILLAVVWYFLNVAY